MSWVLILTVVYTIYGTSTTSIDFTTKEACVAAAKQHSSSMGKAKGDNVIVVSTCTQK